MQLTALRFFSCSWTSTQFFATPLHMFLTSVMWLCLFFQLNNPVYLMKTLLKYSQLRLAFAFLCWFFHFELNIVACSSFCLFINVHNYHCGGSTHALSLLSLCFSSSIPVLSLSSLLYPLLFSSLSSPQTSPKCDSQAWSVRWAKYWYTNTRLIISLLYIYIFYSYLEVYNASILQFRHIVFDIKLTSLWWVY